MLRTAATSLYRRRTSTLRSPFPCPCNYNFTSRPSFFFSTTSTTTIGGGGGAVVEPLVNKAFWPSTYFGEGGAKVLSWRGVRCISSTNSIMTEGGPLQEAITAKITEAFTPEDLKIMNESHMHNVPSNSETHFKVVVVSEAFEGKKLLAVSVCSVVLCLFALHLYIILFSVVVTVCV